MKTKSKFLYIKLIHKTNSIIKVKMTTKCKNNYIYMYFFGTNISAELCSIHISATLISARKITNKCIYVGISAKMLFLVQGLT